MNFILAELYRRSQTVWAGALIRDLTAHGGFHMRSKNVLLLDSPELLSSGLSLS